MLSHRQIKILAECVEEAAGWKGGLMPEQYEDFDAWIDEARAAIKQLRAEKRGSQIQGLAPASRRVGGLPDPNRVQANQRASKQGTLP